MSILYSSIKFLICENKEPHTGKTTIVNFYGKLNFLSAKIISLLSVPNFLKGIMSPVCAFKPRTEKIYPIQSSLYIPSHLYIIPVIVLST